MNNDMTQHEEYKSTLFLAAAFTKSQINCNILTYIAINLTQTYIIRFLQTRILHKICIYEMYVCMYEVVNISLRYHGMIKNKR